MTIRINDRRLWVSLVALIAVLGLVALAVDSDNDGMSDAYETLFSLNPTNAADALLDSDGDGVTNWQECAMGTDPWRADTDLDGFPDNMDSNPVSRLVIYWGVPANCTTGGVYQYTGPAWWVSAQARGGEWATNPASWHVAASESNSVGGLEIAVDRQILTNNAVLSFDFLDTTDGALYVSLLDSSNAAVVVTDVCGNVMSGTGEWVHKLVDLPLADHPDANQILIWRAGGEVRVATNMIYVDQDHDGLDQEQEAQLGTSDLDPDSDHDGLSDYDEVFKYHTNPALADTDGDGMPDGWEIQYGLNPLVNDAASDKDGDGTSNLDEYLQGRDPTKGVVADTAQAINLKIHTPLEQ